LATTERRCTPGIFGTDGFVRRVPERRRRRAPTVGESSEAGFFANVNTSRKRSLSTASPATAPKDTGPSRPTDRTGSGTPTARGPMMELSATAAKFHVALI